MIEILNANNYPFVGWNYKKSAYQAWIVREKKSADITILAFYELIVFITLKGAVSLVKSVEISISLGQIMFDSWNKKNVWISLRYLWQAFSLRSIIRRLKIIV